MDARQSCEQITWRLHGVSYTRLYNADILAMLAEFAAGFQSPQVTAFGGKDESDGPGLSANMKNGWP